MHTPEAGFHTGFFPGGGGNVSGDNKSLHQTGGFWQLADYPTLVFKITTF